METDDFRESDNVVDRRGSSGGFRVGGMSLGTIVVLCGISYFTGINPLTLIGGYEAIEGNGGGTSSQTSPSDPQAQASEKFVRQILGSTEDTWSAYFAAAGGPPYRAPKLVLFSGSTTSGCGMAQTAMGPFYCPVDQTVYLDTQFFDQMRTQFNACPAGPKSACDFAFAYVIAHEIGHHVQNLLGILPRVQEREQEVGSVQRNAISVKTELQADCFAGVWANRTQQKFDFIQPGDVRAALQTAQAIGDDMLQKQSQGYVVPDSFTHGTSAQREYWFMTGLKNGTIQACNTFNSDTSSN
ncbi:neutral zinc metallopeptidase [Bradyrhizobium sp. LHD-71]|uniref:KPN_02809 family neutral zinc metallopeptidase n=1 Tax=Bradyrhizobium sp. LHD-71 TaxID=3072141 RepID=UPI00280D7598|nr:neutral zinc metallopeptidase [Bradyrhizobium sp. LHD-71]MDQ8729187.1 neutral zinc metallopeptidase [Bradyrhizobium sp. LHD-71]